MNSARDQIDVLHVDDDADFLEVASDLLERENDRFSVETATTAQEGLRYFESAAIDCIISDYDMPNMDGLEFLEEVRRHNADLPFILYTGKGNEEIASEAISAGVTDYLQKAGDPSQYTVLANRILNAVSQYQSFRELQLTERRYRSIFEDPNILAGILTPAGRLVEVNQTAMGYIDESKETVTGEAFWETPWWDDELHPRIQDMVSRARDGEYVEYDVALENPSGEPYYVSGVIRPVTDSNGTVVSLIVSARDITERKKREQRLERTSARLEALFENSPDMINIHDKDGGLIDPNPMLCEQTGYTADELTEMKVWDLDQDIDPDEARSLWEEMDVGDRERLEGTYRRKDGSTFPVEVHVRRLDLEGQERFLVISRDITERKERERELEQFETIIEATGDGLYTTNRDGEFTYMNDAFCEIVGYESDELLGEHVSVVADEETVERGEQLIQQLLSTDLSHATFEVLLKTGHGETVPTEIHIALLPFTDEFRGTIGSVRNITDRKERERELELYQTMIETIPDGVYALDDDLRYIAVNDGMEDLTGYSKEELIGSHISIINTENAVETAEDHRQQILESEEDVVFQTERTHYKADGSPVHCEARFRKLPPGEDGSFRGTAGVLRDISEHQRRERELRRQNERLERFVSIVSHDLRNPLNVAQGRVEMVKQEFESSDLDTAVDALYRMETLIDDLLTLAREGKTVQEPDQVDLAEVIQTCWQTVDTKDSHLDIETAQVIEADESRLKQLLENLIGNAVEHSGPSVNVTVGALEDGFYVEDDGPGIPEADREKVFSSGFTTSHTGTGFGLSIVKEIAEAHGWSLNLTTGEMGGARFEVQNIKIIEE